MKISTTDRGFRRLFIDGLGEIGLEVQESAIVWEYADALDKPGSSALWFRTAGKAAELNREAVAELVSALSTWLSTGRLSHEDR